MRSSGFAEAYTEARAEIDSIDALMREVDKSRIAAGLSKAELARRAGLKPEAVRRLFTAKVVNPTLHTILALIHALHLELCVQSPHSAASNEHARC